MNAESLQSALFCFLILLGWNQRIRGSFKGDIRYHTLNIRIKNRFHYHSALQCQLNDLNLVITTSH